MSGERNVPTQPARVMFIYWGRRGALSQLILEVAHAARADKMVDATISVSRQNENFASYKELGSALFAVDTFQTNAGALFQAARIPLLRRRLYHRLRQDRIQAVIELMTQNPPLAELDFVTQQS